MDIDSLEIKALHINGNKENLRLNLNGEMSFIRVGNESKFYEKQTREVGGKSICNYRT